MKKIIMAITVTVISLGIKITVHAADILDKDYIEKEIWEEVWLGKGDNGTDFPEASYKHHLLEQWLDKNYSSDDYDWSELGELKYEYKSYYEKYTDGWKFSDDENGNWTIETDDNFYRFQLISNTWNMIDENGDTVDMFPPFSTEEEQDVPLPNGNVPNNDGSNPNRVIGQIEKQTEKAAEDNLDSKSNITSEESQSHTEHSVSSVMPIIIGIAALIGIGAVLFIFRNKKK